MIQKILNFFQRSKDLIISYFLINTNIFLFLFMSGFLIRLFIIFDSKLTFILYMVIFSLSFILSYFFVKGKDYSQSENSFFIYLKIFLLNNIAVLLGFIIVLFLLFIIKNYM